MSQTDKKLLGQVREAIRLKHYSARTEKAYIHRIKRYTCFHGVRHPAGMGTPDIQALPAASPGGVLQAQVQAVGLFHGVDDDHRQGCFVLRPGDASGVGSGTP